MPLRAAADILVDCIRRGNIRISTAYVALLQFRHSATVEGQGEIRIKFDRLIVILDGAVVLSLSVECGAAVVEGLRIFGTELNRSIVI
jgi:hypothetical protein